MGEDNNTNPYVNVSCHTIHCLHLDPVPAPLILVDCQRPLSALELTNIYKLSTNVNRVLKKLRMQPPSSWLQTYATHEKPLQDNSTDYLILGMV